MDDVFFDVELFVKDVDVEVFSVIDSKPVEDVVFAVKNLKLFLEYNGFFGGVF